VKRAFRVLVILAIGCGLVGLICGTMPFIWQPQERSSFFIAGSFVSGTAELLRTPATVLALAAAVGAVFLRALTWRKGRPGVARHAVDASETPAPPLRGPLEP
jgi:hypothetical protein